MGKVDSAVGTTALFPGPGGVVINSTTIQVSVNGSVSGSNNFLDRSTVVSPTVGIISGSVLRDANGNGVIDTGDVGLPGVTVQLFTQLNAFIAQTKAGSHEACDETLG